MTWLTATPIAVVRAFSEMVEPLSAEESLARATETAVARNLRPGRWAKDQLKRWTRAASSVVAAAVKSPPAEVLRAIGIGVRKKEKKSG